MPRSKLNEGCPARLSTPVAFGDKTFEDRVGLWAATEMFVTSKSKMYFDVIEQNVEDSGNAAVME
jgi:hypothetical protein